MEFSHLLVLIKVLFVRMLPVGIFDRNVNSKKCGLFCKLLLVLAHGTLEMGAPTRIGHVLNAASMINTTATWRNEWFFSWFYYLKTSCKKNIILQGKLNMIWNGVAVNSLPAVHVLSSSPCASCTFSLRFDLGGCKWQNDLLPKLASYMKVASLANPHV